MDNIIIALIGFAIVIALNGITVELREIELILEEWRDKDGEG